MAPGVHVAVVVERCIVSHRVRCHGAEGSVLVGQSGHAYHFCGVLQRLDLLKYHPLEVLCAGSHADAFFVVIGAVGVDGQFDLSFSGLLTLLDAQRVKDLVLEGLGGGDSEGRVVAKHALDQLNQTFVLDVGEQVTQAFNFRRAWDLLVTRLVKAPVVVDDLLLGDEAEVLVVLSTDDLENFLELVAL